jgi:8-oxo-dGTP diphosphatase
LIHRNTVQFKHWELPGGKIKLGESDKQAAIRELEEELGIGVEIIKKLGSTNFTDKNGVFNYTWFLARISKSGPKVLEEKFDNYRYISWEELPSLELSANMQKLLAKVSNKEIVLTP